MSGILIVLILAMLFFIVRSAHRKSKEAVTPSSTRNSKRYFPEEAISALLEEKYADSSGTGYWACFRDDDGDWWNVKVPHTLYDALEVDSHELLLLDAGGQVFIRFGEIQNEDADAAEALPELEMESDTTGEFDSPDILSETEWDELEAFWEEPLPLQIVELRAETSDLGRFDPTKMLTDAGLPKYMLVDGYVGELIAEVYATVREELAGYEGYPRQAEAGNLLDHRGNSFHLYMTIVENQPPLDSRVEGTLSINQIEW